MKLAAILCIINPRRMRERIKVTVVGSVCLSRNLLCFVAVESTSR